MTTEPERPKPLTEHQVNERMMARWTRVVGWLTAALVVVGIVSAYIFHGQLQEMQRQSAITLVQLQPKPVLAFTTGGTCENGTGTWITPVWQNHGTTDAVDWLDWDAMKFFADGVPDNFNYAVTNPAGPEMSLGAGASLLQVSLCLLNVNVQQTENDHGTEVMWGYAEYQDSLPDHVRHQIHWCTQIVPIQHDNQWSISFSAYRDVCNFRN